MFFFFHKIAVDNDLNLVKLFYSCFIDKHPISVSQVNLCTRLGKLTMTLPVTNILSRLEVSLMPFLAILPRMWSRLEWGCWSIADQIKQQEVVVFAKGQAQGALPQWWLAPVPIGGRASSAGHVARSSLRTSGGPPEIRPSLLLSHNPPPTTPILLQSTDHQPSTSYHKPIPRANTELRQHNLSPKCLSGLRVPCWTPILGWPRDDIDGDKTDMITHWQSQLSCV